ncbi:MAG TPA: hypothetical protein VIQ30_02620 [Pseudonocardia sp.]
MAYIWLGRNARKGVGPIGDWNEDRNGKWIYDKNAPTPGQNPAVTQMLNAVTYPQVHEPTELAPSGFQTDDGSWYARASADEFTEAT